MKMEESIGSVRALPWDFLSDFWVSLVHCFSTDPEDCFGVSLLVCSTSVVQDFACFSIFSFFSFSSAQYYVNNFLV